MLFLTSSYFNSQVREQLRILMELAEKKGLGEMLSAISEGIEHVTYLKDGPKARNIPCFR